MLFGNTSKERVYSYFAFFPDSVNWIKEKKKCFKNNFKKDKSVTFHFQRRYIQSSKQPMQKGEFENKGD